MRGWAGVAVLLWVSLHCEAGNQKFLHYGHCWAEDGNFNFETKCSDISQFNATRDKRELTEDLQRYTLQLAPLSTSLGPEQHFQDIKFLKKSTEVGNYACAKIGRYLVGLQLKRGIWVECWKEKVFSDNWEFLQGKYPWITADILQDGDDIIVLKSDRFLRFFKPKKDFSGVNEITESLGLLDDFYGWQGEGASMLLGNFYPEKQFYGVFTKKDGKINFYVINEKLLEDDDVILELETTKQDLFWMQNSTKFFLHRVNQNSEIMSFVLLNGEELRIYDFDSSYKMKLKLKVQLILNQGTSSIFFANLTDRHMKDLLILNDLGLFVYVFSPLLNSYEIDEVDTMFSKANGWSTQHTDSFQVLGIQGIDYIVFSGPKGLQVLKYNPTESDLDIWTNVLVEKHTKYPKTVRTMDNFIFSQKVTGEIEYARLENSKTKKEPLIPKIESSKEIPDFFNFGPEKIIKNVFSPLKKVSQIKPILRWSERWPDNFAKQAVQAGNGNVAFHFPLVNISLTLNLGLEIFAFYDSSRDSHSSSMGKGWSINLMQDFIIVNYQQSIFPTDHNYYINRGGNVEWLVFESQTGEELEFTIKNTTEKVKFSKDKNIWTYFSEKIKKTYGQCGENGAIHWSLGWKNWRGPGTDLSSLENLPAAWHLCQKEEISNKNTITYQYHQEWQNFENQRIVTNLRIKKIFHPTFKVSFTYQEKDKDEYQINDPFDDFNGVYTFPTPLQEKYILREILTDHDEFKQSLLLGTTKKGSKRLFTTLHQTDRSINELLFSADYTNIENNLVITKFVSQNNLSVEFHYELLYYPVFHPAETKFPLYSGMKMSGTNEYLAKANINILDKHQVIVTLMNNLATRETHTFTVNASTKVDTFEVSTLTDQIVVVIFTENDKEIHTIYKCKKTWCLLPNKTRVKKKSVISVYDGVIIQAINEEGVINILDWDPKILNWKKTALRSPKLTKFATDNNHILGYGENELWLFHKNAKTLSWEQNKLDIGNFRLEDCEVLNRFNYKKEVRDQICEHFLTKNFYMNKNLIFLSRVFEHNDYLTLRGLFLILDQHHNVVDKKEVDIYSANLLSMTKTQETTFDKNKNVTLYMGHIFKNGKINIRVQDLRGEVIEGASEYDKEQILEHYSSQEQLTTWSLVSWENFTAGLDNQGVRLLAHPTIYRMTGEKWTKMPLKHQNKINLGKNLILESNDDQEFVLVGKLPYGNRVLEKFKLIKRGEILVRYPEYIAYHSAETTVNLILFKDKDTIWEKVIFQKERILFSSGYNSLITVVNTTSSDVQFSTSQYFIVRPISSWQVKSPVPAANLLTTSNGIQQRKTGYKRQFNVDRENQILTQTITVIPGGSPKVSGWVEKEVVINLLTEKTTENSKAYDSDGNEVKILERKSQTSTSDETGLELYENTMLWDVTNELEISNFFPYSLEDDECDYYGFERYEQKNKWSFSSKNIVENEFSLTGKNFLRLINSSLSRKLTPKTQTGTYIASCWLRTSQDISIGKPYNVFAAEIQINGAHFFKQLGENKRVNGAWRYFELRIDFDYLHEIYQSYLENSVEKKGQSEILKFTVVLEVQSDDSVVDVDHIRFTPLAQDFSANVYNDKNQETEKILNNGLITRRIFNRFGQKIASIAENGQVFEVVTGSYTGHLLSTLEIDQKIQRQITLKPETGFVETFDEVSFVKRWKTSGSNWQVAPYTLRHTDSKWHEIKTEPSLIFSQSAAIRLDFVLNEEKSALNFITSTSVFELKRQEQNTILTFSNQKFTNLPLTGELLFFENQLRVAIFIDGVLVVDEAKQGKRAAWESFSIKAFGSVEIQNLVVMRNPNIEILYLNKWGDVSQVLRLEDSNSVLVVETLYDELGRGAIISKSTRITAKENQPLFAKNTDFIQNEKEIWENGKAKGLIDKLNPADQGYAYSRTVYHANPLNQKLVEGLPGASFSVNGPFKRKFQTESDIPFLSNLFPPRKGFRQETFVEPNESIHVSVFDKHNNNVAKYTQVYGFDHVLIIYEYDENKRLVKILPPSYHEKADTALKTDPWIPGEKHLKFDEKKLQLEHGTFFAFDHEGNMVKKSTPDSGTTEYVYTKGGNIRFMYSINSTTNLTDNLIYYQYDGQGQMTETGEVTTSLTREEIAKYTDNTYIPGKVAYQQIQFQDAHYDPDLRGRSQIITTETGEGLIVDNVIYNAEQEIISKTTVPLTNWSDFSAFTNLNKTFIGSKLHTLEYPMEVNGKPLVLLHTYNRVGHLKSLGVPGKTDLFATFEYNVNGNLAKERYQINGEFSRKYLYDSPGYLLTISDPFLSQDTTYTSGGYGQDGFGDGMIMSTSYQAHWLKTTNKADFILHENSLPEFQYSKMCIKFLKKRGFLDNKGRVQAVFSPEIETDVPILCTGPLGYQLAKITTEFQPAEKYGFCFAYGNHKELIKAKYFSDPDQNCLQPLQPLSFAERNVLTSEQSSEIFDLLVKNKFLISDKVRYNNSFTIGTSGKNFLKEKEMNEILDKLSVTSYTFGFYIRKLIIRALSENREITKEEFLAHFRDWDMNPEPKPEQISTKEDLGLKIYEALLKTKLLPTKADRLSCLESNFLRVLQKYKSHIPLIIKVLHRHFSKSLGKSPFDVMSYKIDPNGNHREFKVGYNHFSFQYYKSTNKIETVELRSIFTENEVKKFSMGHDSKGNVIQAKHRGIIDLSYNPVSQRTTSITMETGQRLFFFYDARGERILKQALDNTGNITHEKYYLRDDEGRVIMDRDVFYHPSPISPDTISTAYIYGPKGLFGFIRNEEFYSVTLDHQGSIRLVVKNGEVVAAYDYLPYGEFMRVYGSDPSSHITYRYTGQEYDAETGLYNYHARLYDPSIGRFYQPDPMAQYSSPYKYAGNSPVSLVDPDGEFAFLLFFAIAFAIGGAYLGGAAANNSWNPAKWKWNAKTFLGMFGGALTGFFLPITFGWSVTFLMGAGLSMGTAIATSAVLGVGMAYVMGAATQGLDPTKWKWKEPGIWNELFGGFATGAGFLGNFGSISQLGGKVGQWSLKMALKTNSKILTFFLRMAKPTVIGASYLAGATLGYVGAVQANGGKHFWQWDWSDPKTWAALINGFDAGAGIPENFLSAGGGMIKMFKNRKGLLTMFKNFSPAKMAMFAKTLKNHKNPVYKMVLTGMVGYLSGSQANDNFTNWDWSSFGTYQGLFNGMFLGKNLIGSVAAAAKGNKNHKSEIAKLPKNKTRIFLKITENMISKVFKSIHRMILRGAHFTKRGAEILMHFVGTASKKAKNYFSGGEKIKKSIGNRRGQHERLKLADAELNKINKINEESIVHVEKDETLYLEKDVDFLSCSKGGSRRKRALPPSKRCRLSVIKGGDAEDYINNTGKSRKILQRILDKTPRAHSANQIGFYPEFMVGGVHTHLLTNENTNVAEAFLLRKKKKSVKRSEQTILLIHKNNDGTVHATIKKIVADVVDGKNYKKDWDNNKLFDKTKLKEALIKHGVAENDINNVKIDAELSVIHDSSKEVSISFSEGKTGLTFENLKDIEGRTSYEYLSIFEKPKLWVGSIGDRLRNAMDKFRDNNNGLADDATLEALRKSAIEVTESVLETYKSKRGSRSGETPLESEFHAYLYGALDLNIKKGSALISVENVAGKGELDMLFSMLKIGNTENQYNVPAIFELKSKAKPAGSDETKAFLIDGLKVETTETKPGIIKAHFINKGKVLDPFEQVSRKGYHFNMPLNTLSEKVLVVSVDSNNGKVDAKILDVPKYEGLANTLMAGVDDPMKIMKQIVYMHYSYSNYAIKQGENRYMSRFAMGEIIGRANEVYISTTNTGPDSILFKNDKSQWVLLQIVDGQSQKQTKLTIPEGIDPIAVKKIVVEVPKKFVEQKDIITLDTQSDIVLESGNSNFQKIPKIAMDPVNRNPSYDRDSSFKPIMDNLSEIIKKIPNLVNSEADVQSLLQGIIYGNQNLFTENGQNLRVYSESSLSSKGRIDLVLTIADSATPRHQDLIVIELKYLKNTGKGDFQKQLNTEMDKATEQVMKYFDHNHFESLTDKKMAQATVLVVDSTGDVYYRVYKAHMGKTPTFTLKHEQMGLYKEKERRRPPGKRSIEQEGPENLSPNENFIEEQVFENNNLGFDQVFPNFDLIKKQPQNYPENFALNESLNENYIEEQKVFENTDLSFDQVNPNFDLIKKQEKNPENLSPNEKSLQEFSKNTHQSLNSNLNKKLSEVTFRPLITRRKILEWYTTSSGSRLEFWPIYFIKSVFSLLSQMWDMSGTALPKRELNKIKQFQAKMSNGDYFSMLDLGDQWLKDTNFQGNLLWLFIIVKKLTKLDLYVDRPRHRKYMRELDILACDVTYDFSRTLIDKSQTCGIPTVVRKVMDDVNFATVSNLVYRKLFSGDIDEVGEILFKEIVLKNIDKITKNSSEKQAKKLVDLVLLD